MNPRNLTREAIEELNDIEPYCFETDREEQWFNIGLQYGLDVSDSNPISPWISVEDDLPYRHFELLEPIPTENFEGETISVLVIDNKGYSWLDYMVLYKNIWKWKHLESEPSYWMQIPELPKE